MRALLADGGMRDVPFVDTEMRNLCAALDIQMDLLRSVKAPTLPEDAFTPILLNCSTQRISLTANRRLPPLRLLPSRAIKPDGLVSRQK